MSELKSSQSATAPPPPCTTQSFLPETAAFRKSQHLLDFTVAALFMRHGVTRVMFVTLTCKKRVRSTVVAHKKLNSFMNAVRKRYGCYLWVMEPHESGSIHYHLLIPLDFDCHAGTDLDAWSEKFFPLENTYFHSENPARCGKSTRDTYLRNSMNPALRAEADWWKTAVQAHGFGKVRVEPIYRGADAIRKYMAKQDWRTRPWPFTERKNVRFWSCSSNLRAGNVKFAWNSVGARRGRERMAGWAKERNCESIDDLQCVIGSRWGYIYLCEVVWGVKPKVAEPPPVTCPFPRRRYNNPDFQPHPGLYDPPQNNIVGISTSSLILPSVGPGGAGEGARPKAESAGDPARAARSDPLPASPRY